MAIDTRARRVEPAAEEASPRRKPARGSGKITGRDRIFFTERLALLLHTGNALQPSLNSLRLQARKPELSAIIENLSEQVLGGQSFSQALAGHPRMFSATYVNLVKAGEQGGFMPEVLTRLQEMDEKRESLRATLVAALSYPVFLIFFSFAVVLFILVAVFPKFSELFVSIRDQLPFTTVALMALSDLLTRHWLLLFGAMTALTLAAGRWLATSPGVESVDRLRLSIPLVREIHIQLYLIQSLRVLSLSLANGVPVLDALRACQEAVGNVVFRRFMAEVERQVTEGRGLAAGFEGGAFIPAMVSQMMRTGEESGNLAKVAERIADFYERELARKLTLVAKIVEPVMLLVMGVVVGLIVASLILPIFKLSRAVH